MSNPTKRSLLEAILISWDRNNTILVNLLGILPAGGLDARVMAGSPTVAGMAGHIHRVRLLLVLEDAPEFGRELSEEDRAGAPDLERLTRMLNESARAVRAAVEGRVAAGRQMSVHYDHPIFMLQHLIWHEGYHHGQIKLALKAIGHPLDDEEAGPVTWDIWMQKNSGSAVDSLSA